MTLVETLEWISPAGVTTELYVRYGVRGRFAPPSVIRDEEVPGGAGSRFREARHGPREFALPLLVEGATEAATRLALRQLIREMDPTKGAGKIRTTTAVGDQREIGCRYVSGLDLDETESDTYTEWQRAVAVFRAFDPYWYDVSDTIETYTVGAQATFFPIFPLRLSSSEVFVDAQVANNGDLEAWPVWTINGPGSKIVLRDLGASLFTSLTSGLGTVTLGVGESMEIDTRPGFKTFTKNDGTNLWPFVSSDSTIWPLADGTTAVRVEMSGATELSSVKLAFRPRYLTP